MIKNNRLSHYAGVGFTYDRLGNTLATTYDKDNRVSYRYDLHDRLIGAEIATRYRKEHWVYYYDAVGRRIAKAKLNKQGEPEIHTLFVWDGSHLVQEIQKGKNSQETDRTFTYIYTHPDSYEPLAQCIDRRDEQGNRIEHEINYFHCDQIGIPREMTDSQGKLIWRGRYDAWGGLHYDRHLAQQNQGHQPFRLQNQYIDQETGLHYNFLRYYEPMTGRFITQDPIGLAGGENFYRFGNNTFKYVDQLGLSAVAAVTAGFEIDLSVPEPTDINPLKWLGWGAAFVGAAAIDYFAAKYTTEKLSNLRQKEYEYAKNFCDTPPPPGNNKCSTLSKQIDHAEKCIDLYEKWDNKWLPGRHSEKLNGWRNRLNNLKEEAKKNCG